MLLYTVLDPESVLTPCDYPCMSAQRIPEGFLELTSGAQGQVVSRLISTDPMAYLKSGFSPGSSYPHASLEK